MQRYLNWLIAHDIHQPDKYTAVPKGEVSTALSERWQRCAWQQACGIAQSWFSNARENRPELHHVCIQANANVVVIEPSRTSQFNIWLRISTLEAEHPFRIPIKLYAHGKETLAQFPNLCRGVTLSQREGEWFATFVVERKGPKTKSSEVVGVDIGMVSIVSTSRGRRYGQVSAELRRRVEHANAKRRRKQKLNACLKRKKRSTRELCKAHSSIRTHSDSAPFRRNLPKPPPLAAVINLVQWESWKKTSYASGIIPASFFLFSPLPPIRLDV